MQIVEKKFSLAQFAENVKLMRRAYGLEQDKMANFLTKKLEMKTTRGMITTYEIMSNQPKVEWLWRLSVASQINMNRWMETQLALSDFEGNLLDGMKTGPVPVFQEPAVKPYSTIPLTELLHRLELLEKKDVLKSEELEFLKKEISRIRRDWEARR